MKLTKEELKSLKQAQENSKNLIIELGQIEITKQNLKSRKNKALQYLNQLKQQEAELAESLEKKYGKGTVDIDSGEFLPA